MPLSDLPHSPLPNLGPWPQSFLDDIHLALLDRANAPTFRDRLINGGMQAWQDGTGATTVTGYTRCDLWRQTVGAGATCSVSGVSIPLAEAETLPGVPALSLQWARTVTGAAPSTLASRIEGVRTLGGQPCVFSCYLKTPIGATFDLVITQDFNTGSGGSPQVVTTVTTFTATSADWVRYSIAFTMPSLVGKTVGTSPATYVEVALSRPAVAASDGTWQVMGAQLEEGVTATAFLVVPLVDELPRIARYYETSYPYGLPPGTAVASGAPVCRAATAGTLLDPMAASFTVRKRPGGGAPVWYSTVTGNANRVRNTSAGADVVVTGGYNNGDSFTGYPVIGAAVVGNIYEGHWVVDSRL